MLKTSCECGMCNSIKITRDVLNLEMSGRGTLSSSEVLELLKQISDDDLQELGIKSRPEFGILTVLPIAPPCIRPSTVLGSFIKSENDLTYKYVDIVRSNEMLRKHIADREEDLQRQLKRKNPDNVDEFVADWNKTRDRYIQDQYTHLKIHVTTLYNNRMAGVPIVNTRTNRQFACFTQKLSSKYGRIRGNLIGKRVNGSARTVLTSDSNLDISQVGIPREFAMELTVSERVCDYNIHDLSKAVERGPLLYPGAIYIERNGARFAIETLKRRVGEKPELQDILDLQHGDIVYRHLIDGDLVLLNRQPSLHKMSMMCHEVKVHRNRSFSINPNVCAPYNADCDGDELNILIPRHVQVAIEMRELMSVDRNLITPQSGEAIVNFMQDTLLGIYLLQSLDKVDQKTAWSLIPELVSNFRKTEYTPTDLLSYMLPRRLYIKGVVEGETILTKMTKATCRDIIQAIYIQISPNAAAQYISEMSRFITRFIEYHGFTVSMKDVIPNEKLLKDIDNVLISRPHEEARDAAGALVVDYARSTNNNIFHMVNSGSKGSPVNLAQIMGVLGMQESLKGHGFCSNSFYRGLNPQETYHHLLAGRMGLIDTAVKTADTGYLQRKLIKNMEDVYIRNNFLAADVNGNIVQFVYGGDFFDGTMESTYRWMNELVDRYNKNTGSSSQFSREMDLLYMLLTPTPQMRLFSIFSNHRVHDILARVCNCMDTPTLQEFVEKFYELYIRALVQPGEAVGTVAAQSIGEQLTQMTLNTFHSTGISSASPVAGLPRIRALLAVSKNMDNSVTRIESTPGVQFSTVYFSQICTRFNIWWRDCKFYLDLHFDLGKFPDLEVLDILEKLDIDLDNPKFSLTDRAFYVRGYSTESDMDVLRTRLNGLTFGEKFTKYTTTKDETVLIGQGDVVRKGPFYTNNVDLAFKMYGIEMARRVMIEEMGNTLRSNGVSVLPRHLELVCDVVTQTGIPVAFDRTGQRNARGAEVLANSSFEEAVNVFSGAAFHGTTDAMNSITSCIITGQICKFGSNMNPIEYKFDTQKHN